MARKAKPAHSRPTALVACLLGEAENFQAIELWPESGILFARCGDVC